MIMCLNVLFIHHSIQVPGVRYGIIRMILSGHAGQHTSAPPPPLYHHAAFTASHLSGVTSTNTEWPAAIRFPQIINTRLHANKSALFPASNTKRRPSAGITLGQRRRRWTKVIPALCIIYQGVFMPQPIG